VRDILTVIAVLLIAALTAALVAPPFIDWGEYRQSLHEMLARATGTRASTEGRITVRLLPSPRFHIDQLELGGSTEASPSLKAREVMVEIALTPLLSGHVRFTDARIRRAEIRLPTGAGGSLRLPADIPSAAAFRREWAIENLTVGELLVTTTVPATGRTDQFFAENVHIEGQSLIGPWRVEGTTAGVPFRLATGELGQDQTVQVKLFGGGDLHPRFDIEAKLAFENEANAWTPNVSGAAKVFFGPPAQISATGLPIPVTVQTGFKTAGGAVELEPVAIEAGEGGGSLRLTGGGAVSLSEPRVSLKLQGRRLDVDSFLLSASGRELVARAGSWSLPPLFVPVDLDLSLNSIGLAQEELSNLVARLTLDRGRARVTRLEVEAPGQTRVAAEGEIGLTTEAGGGGRIAIATPASDRFARYIAKLGVRGPFLAFLDGRPLEAAADIVHAAPVTSFRNVRAKLGDAMLTGNARYTGREQSARARLEAQVALQGVDLANLPQMSSLFESTQNLDLGIILDARDVRHAGSKSAGRITARILSDAPSLVVETLEITDLAGANARVNGRIEPDGTGRIEGRVTAQRAAPLVDLIGSVWIGGVSKLVPPFLREGDLNIDLVAERAAPSERSGLRLKTTAKGIAAGGAFEAEVLSADGYTESLDVRLATENTGIWVNRPDAAPLRRPSHLDLRGVRVPSGRFNVMVTGEVGGVKINTTRPVALGADDEVVDSGEADFSAADVTPFLVLLGDGAGVQPPVPLQLRVSLGRERDATLIVAAGKVGDAGVQARLSARSRADVTGTVTADRLSLPWVAAAFALSAAPEPRATALWSTARFGQGVRAINGGQAAFKVARLELGRGLTAENAAFTLSLTGDGFVLRDLSAGLAGGQMTGGLSITRQGTLASIVGEGTVQDVAMTQLGTVSPLSGRVSGKLKFGASGESMSSIVANLAGGGELRVGQLEIANADPGAIERGLARGLRENDPLAARRLETIFAEELNRGPLRAEAVSAPAALVGGVLRLNPLVAQTPEATWQGSASFDVRTLNLDARGTLTSKSSPKGWGAASPVIGLGWQGPIAKAAREVDVGPLVNGIAAIVLQRELEKIEAFEADIHERARLNQQQGMERAREQARREAEEAARRAAEEAARQRAAEEARQRAAEEAARQARLRREQEERIRALQSPPPIDIRPPPQAFPEPRG
jgi:uncharacterized protein involved in outer membrane biogenesis